ncbi:YceD family protein [Proteiniphilum acetatigenes]|uniref:YceD family protein n=1 Tax=Proteiniphilum acetatigenes TaxID=294710 RepID=UPI00037C7182|nr:DUF177 domain-containing protein [Proteiniphilum acetatigenes]SFK42529.1 Uncharacterized metal-binding protein YceD, DUF177 family [Porphyromonadaceae bacterium KH3CP3RA]
MAKFSLYNISLKNLSEGVHTFEYDLDRKFFDAIDGDEVRKGNVKVTVKVRKTSSTFEFNFDLKGIIQVPCTRCLDDMNLDVDTQSRLIVKFGKEYSEESDEIVIIPEEEGEINIAWFLYEFIALTIPIKHVHPTGECNRVVSSKLRKHRAVSTDDADDDDGEIPDDDFSDEDESQDNDPRWDALKGLNLEEN